MQPAPPVEILNRAKRAYDGHGEPRADAEKLRADLKKYLLMLQQSNQSKMEEMFSGLSWEARFEIESLQDENGELAKLLEERIDLISKVFVPRGNTRLLPFYWPAQILLSWRENEGVQTKWGYTETPRKFHGATYWLQHWLGIATGANVLDSEAYRILRDKYRYR